VSCPSPSPARNGNRRGHTLRLAALALAGGLAAAALGQGRPYYNITSIEAKRLTNGVILTIKADGSMADIHAHDWTVLSDGEPRPVKEIELHCGSAKSQVGDFVDISKYPISHVELIPRVYSNDGIGLDMRIKLYTEARIRHFRTERFTGDWWWRPTMGCCFDGELGRDQQSLVITVVSDRFSDPEPVAEAPATQELSLEPGPDGTFSLYALNLDLRRLTHELGRQAGVRIVVDESVTRYITVSLPEMTPPELLRSIAAGYGLALEDQGGQYVLSKGLPANVATYETNVTQVVTLQHLAPEAALDLLPNFLLAYVRPSEAQNALIVAGPEQLVRRVREDVAKIDSPPQQLRIELAAVKIASTDAWNAAFRGEASGGNTAGGLDSDAGSLSVQYLDQPPEGVRAHLRRLERSGAVDTLAKAHVTLVNGKWASLFLGEKQYIQVWRNTEYGDDQIAIPVDLGVEVGVIAWTGGEGIALWLNPVVTTLGGLDPTTDLPIVDRYETQGAIIVPDGHTLLLGGVRLKADSHLLRGAGAAPLPRSRSAMSEDAEIALFITAYELGEFDTSDGPTFSGRIARELREAGVELEYRTSETPPDADEAVPSMPAREAQP